VNVKQYGIAVASFFYFLEFLLQRRLGKLFLTCKNFYLFLVAKRAVKSKERSQSQEGEEKEGGGKLTMPTSEGPTLAALPGHISFYVCSLLKKNAKKKIFCQILMGFADSSPSHLFCA
jgi:hypothetical protein